MSARFLAMMLPRFLARVRPASTRANPACIMNTRHPATISQRLARRAVLYSAGVSSCAAAGAAVMRTAASMPASPKPILRIRLLELRERQASDMTPDPRREDIEAINTVGAFRSVSGRTRSNLRTADFVRVR